MKEIFEYLSESQTDEELINLFNEALSCDATEEEIDESFDNLANIITEDTDEEDGDDWTFQAPKMNKKDDDTTAKPAAEGTDIVATLSAKIKDWKGPSIFALKKTCQWAKIKAEQVIAIVAKCLNPGKNADPKQIKKIKNRLEKIDEDGLAGLCIIIASSLGIAKSSGKESMAALKQVMAMIDNILNKQKQSLVKVFDPETHKQNLAAKKAAKEQAKPEA